MEEFDVGPLTWVKGEIDQALDSVQENLNTFATNLDDTSVLKFSQTHLYQVTGALDMVGLQGCKRLCQEIDNLLQQLEKKTVSSDEAKLATLTDAIAQLRQYLNDLLNGTPDLPMRLYPSLEQLSQAQGQAIDVTELFFPDTTLRAPKTLPVNTLEEGQLLSFVTEHRQKFQKALLDWLKSGNQQSIAEMFVSVDQVMQVQTNSVNKTLWWVMTAFVETLANASLASNPSVKRLCRQIDQQLKIAAEQTKPPAGLMRDLLYFVGLGGVNTERVRHVKQVFELESLLSSEQSSVSDDVASASHLLGIVATLLKTWQLVAEYNTDMVTECHHQMQSSHAFTQALTHPTKALFVALDELIAWLSQEATRVNDVAIVEVATALGVAERALQQYESIQETLQMQIEAQTVRLQELMQGATTLSSMPDFVAGALEDDVKGALAKQINESLVLAEQSLDGYFRDANNLEALSGAKKPLEEVRAAFEMLEQNTPASISNAALRYVDYFVANPTLNHALDFELLAEGLSALGMYVENMPRIRSEISDMLEQAKIKLEVRQDSLFDVAEQDGSTADEQPVIGQQTAETLETNTENSYVSRPFDPEMLEIYIAEAEEVLASVAQNLQALRINITDAESLAEVRRGYHTLKGSGRMVGLDKPAEVAWSVEKLLNFLMESKANLNLVQLAFLEKASAAFADWIYALRQHGEVSVDEVPWQQEAASLEVVTPKQAAVKEEVLIDGTRKISRGLFNVFLAEAKQHVSTLQSEVANLQDGVLQKPTTPMVRAAHTLASNAGATGFKPILDLGRAFEHWLDEFAGNWTQDTIGLADRVVQSLADMLVKVEELRQPKRATGLLNALKRATDEANLAQEQALAQPVAEQANDELANVKKLLSDINLDDIHQDDTVATPENTELANLEVAIAEQQPETKAIEQDELNELAPEPEPIIVNANAAEEVLPIMETPAEEMVVPNISAAPVEKVKPTKSAKVSKQTPVADVMPAANQELMAIFMEEARELVPLVGKELRAWRASPTEADHADELQRALHTLKGSARMAGQTEMGDAVHGMEDRIVQVLKRQVVMSDFDGMFSDLDHIGALTQALDTALNPDAAPEDRPNLGVAAGRTAERASQFLRMRSEVLDRLINEAGEVSIARSRIDREMQGFKQSSLDLTESVFRLRNYLRELEIETESQMQSRLTLLQETQSSFDPLEFDRFTRLQELTRMMAESVNDVATIQHALLMNLDEAESALQQQNRMNYELQHGLMSVRMVPFSLIVERLHRIVRQTARELNKQVELTIEGEKVDIDRSVLDKIGAPLEHLLRNAVAHGIESPEQRVKMGKPAQGTIQLKVFREKDEIALMVSDDGAGINLAKVRAKAIEKQLIQPDQEVADQTLMSVIFEPGFSTATDVTQIAGRGVGLDAVRGDITGLGGRIDVSNQEKQGAKFSIFLPVTLSVIPVVNVRAGHHVFAIPAIMVEQLQKQKPKDLLATYTAKQLMWADNVYPIHYLPKLIGDYQTQAEPQNYSPILLLRSGTYRVALHIDEVLGNEDVVMKPIGAQVARVPGVAGATVTGEGKIILILNPLQLANREELSAGAVKISTPEIVETKEVTPLVMVVDDSLTMRKVLGRALEREGYQVITAKDGVDALQQLVEQKPDIMLLDIEMPRMDGFELTRNVRNDATTKHIPIIIISSRTAEKHQNVAKELGVNAFLGKPVQDDQLIAEIKRLIAH